MTTDDFVKSISSDDIAHLVTHCFDELMVLYHLVGTRQDIDICNDSSKLPISFILLTETEADAIKLADSMNGLDFSVYSTRYMISMVCTGSSVLTHIKEAS